ncbi:MAG: PAAR domain-containing protein, partial [Microcoleus sp. SIO2G3]|nr:PAAR domain-containing protein [Microcoleus sp. SIO2G3]
MSFPAARVGDLTVTGDAVLPPGVPNVLIGGLPAACVGDKVYGPVINYAPGIIATGGFTVLIGGRPAARVTSMVNGLSIGPLGVPVPVATTIAKGQPNVLIGDMGVAVPPPPEVQAQLK